MNPWPRNDYLNHAESKGAKKDTAIAAWKQAICLQRSGLPPILSLKHLAEHTKNSYQFLRAIVARELDPYRVFRIRKHAGGYRNICAPEPGLLRVQRWIDRFILSKSSAHERAKAYSKGSSVLACASDHAGCRWLIKCDVRQFFESISEIQAYRVFRELGYQPLVCLELTRLVTRVVESEGRLRLARWRADEVKYSQIPSYRNWKIGHLPQGAPTSPKLSNLVMKTFDASIESLANEFDLVYTRYADDLIFSRHTEGFDRADATNVVKAVFKEMRRIGLRPHAAKTTIVPPGGRKIVLGLCVNDLRPRLTQQFKKRLSCHVHYVCRFGIVNHAMRRGFDSVVGFREHLTGLLRYAGYVEPDFVDALREKLDQSDWHEI